jgi:hypothetical protein
MRDARKGVRQARSEYETHSGAEPGGERLRSEPVREGHHREHHREDADDRDCKG